MENTSRTKKFLSGVSWLTLSALAVKVIGLLYKIPLLSYLGTEGMGYFNTAYELYALFCVVSTAGLPVAMAVLISGDETEGGAEKVYRTARNLFLAVGLLGSLIMFSFAEQFAKLLDNSGAAACMRAISPTVLFICLGSAYRGYFQGMGNMRPTALSQIIEAAGKLALGLLLAGYATAKGESPQAAAAYAVLGLTVGTLLSSTYLFISRRVYRKKHLPHNAFSVEKSGGMLKKLWLLAFPVTLSAVVMGGAKFVDLAMILSRLSWAGFSETEANSLYGCYSTLVLPIFNMLPSLTSSVSLSAVPALSSALKKGEGGEKELSDTALTALKLVSYIAIPASMGLSVFAKDILSLLFSSQPAAVESAAPWLSVMALAVLPSCIITVTTGMLQAMGRAKLSLYSMLCGILIKTVLAYLLIGKENIGVLGAPVSSVACDMLVAILNICHIAKYCHQMLPSGREILNLLAVPALASAAAVGAVKLLRGRMQVHTSSFATVLSILSVMLVYAAIVLVLNLKNIKTSERKKYGS